MSLPQHLAFLFCLAIVAPAWGQNQTLSTLDCTGPFARDSDERRLAQVFGAANVERADISIGEGNTEPGTAIFAKDPLKRIDILWHEGYARPNVVIIRNGSTWPVAVTGLDKPIAKGATLAEIEAMNGKPFTLTGFGWDLGGYANGWDGGRLERPVGGCNLSVRFDPASDAPGDALDKVNGDVEFLSTDPAVRQTRPVVIEIELGWPQ